MKTSKTIPKRNRLTRQLGRVRLKVVPLISTVPLDDHLEERRRLLGLLANQDALDMKREGFAVVKDRLGLVCRRHDLWFGGYGEAAIYS